MTTRQGDQWKQPAVKNRFSRAALRQIKTRKLQPVLKSMEATPLPSLKPVDRAYPPELASLLRSDSWGGKLLGQTKPRVRSLPNTKARALLEWTPPQLTRHMQIRLQKTPPDEWRPSIITVTDRTFDRSAPMQMLTWLSHRYGFGTYLACEIDFDGGIDGYRRRS